MRQVRTRNPLVLHHRTVPHLPGEELTMIDTTRIPAKSPMLTLLLGRYPVINRLGLVSGFLWLALRFSVGGEHHGRLYGRSRDARLPTVRPRTG